MIELAKKFALWHVEWYKVYSWALAEGAVFPELE